MPAYAVGRAPFVGLMLLVFLGASAGDAAARPGDLDTRFGPATTNTSGGVAFFPVAGGGDQTAATALVQQPNGRIVVAGNTQDNPGPPLQPGPVLPKQPPHIFAARLRANGRLDRSFGAGGSVVTDLPSAKELATSVALDREGGIVVAASADGRAVLLRYDSAGRLDPGFGAGGVAETLLSHPGTVAVGKEGKLLVTGSLAGDPAVARLTKRGTLDTSFGSSGVSSVTGLKGAGVEPLTQRDGRVLLLGSTSGARRRLLVARMLSSGRIDTSYGHGGIARAAPRKGRRTSGGQDAALQADGKLLVLSSEGSLLRFGPNGQLDRSFGKGARVVWHRDFQEAVGEVPDSVVVEGAGRIVVSSHIDFGIAGYFILRRFDRRGRTDKRFGRRGKKDDPGLTAANEDWAAEMVLARDGGLLLAGASQNDETTDPFVAKVRLGRR